MNNVIATLPPVINKVVKIAAKAFAGISVWTKND